MTTLLDIDKLPFKPPELGCVLCLPGLPGGGNKLYDRSPYGNIGTITGASWKRLPSGLWCLSFDGSDDYVNCGSGGSLDITSALTLKTWVYPDGANEVGYVIAKTATGSPNSGYSLYWNGAADTIQMIGCVTSVRSSNAVFVDDKTWVCVVITFNGTTFTFYRNGVAAGTATDTIPSYPASNVYLGNRQGGGVVQTYFGGDIALPEIIRRCWSPLDVQNHFNQEKHLFGVW